MIIDNIIVLFVLTIISGSLLITSYNAAALLMPFTIVFEKLIVIQLVKKFPSLFGNLKIHYHIQKISPLVLVLSHMNLGHTLSP
jgi:hypothetical protein